MSAATWSNRRPLAEALLLGVTVVWAANFIVVKDIVGVMPPVGFTFLRYLVAAITLLAITRVSEGSLRPPRPDTLRILLLGGFGFGLYQILWTVGLQSIPAGDSALLIASTPVFTAVIAVALGTDSLNRAKGLGVALSFLGVVVVIGAGVGIELSGSPIGFVLTLSAAVCWATYTAFGPRVLRHWSPLVFTTWASVGGAIALAPVGLGQLFAVGAIGPRQVAAAPEIVFAVLYSGVLAAAISNVIVFNAVRLLGPTRVVTVQALVPAMAVVLAYLILSEPIRVGQVVGGAILLSGVALTRIAARRWPARRVAA